MYSRRVANGSPTADVIPFLLCWQQNKTYAEVSEEKVYNVKEDENWKNIAKTDSRKMWKIIEYHEKKTTSTKKHTINSTIINDYFTNIFQAEDLAANPTIEDIQRDVSNYSIRHHYLDREFSYDEMSLAIMSIGRGNDLDGLDKILLSCFQRN